MRRILILLAALIVLGGIAAYIYFAFFADQGKLAIVPPGSITFPSAGQGPIPNMNGGAQSAAAPSPKAVSARLVKITSNIVVPGMAVVVEKPVNASSSPVTIVRYIERQSGNVFAYRPETSSITRTSNKTLPGIQSAAWLPDGTRAFVRYLSGNDVATINTYGLPATDAAEPGLPAGRQGFFLPQNLSDVAVSASGVLTLASGVNGSSASRVSVDGSRPLSAFSTPLTAVRVAFAGNRYFATTRPSALLDGSAFLVDAGGAFTRVAGPLRGLVALPSPSGTFALVSYVDADGLQMQLVTLTNGAALQLPVATIADKCAWSQKEDMVYCGIPADPPGAYSYPDDWYQGAVHFNDQIWKIDVQGRFAQLVLDFQKEARDSLDASALALDPEGTLLVFTNKNDGSLWSYRL